jgi:hypothetical protein
LETPLDAIGAINPQALQTADDEDEEIDVVGLGEEMSTVPHSMDSHQPQSFAIAQPVIFTADSTTQLSMPSVIPGVASIVLPPLSAFSQINTSTPTSSRSTSPTNIKSSRVQPYPTPPHTPKRNTERKRQLHNELERKRREDLNSVFNMLGDVIPSLSVGSKGAPTQTQILQGATSLLKSLKSESTQLATQKDALLSEQSRLKARLAQLASR